MATSGSFKTSGYEGRCLLFSWKEVSQSVTSNTTTISWTLEGDGTGEVNWYKSGNFKVVIDGETVYSSTTRIQLYDGTVVASGILTFTHNDDGTKSFTASAEAGIYTVAVNCNGSGTFTLDTIARASQPSCITYPEHTQNVGNFGDIISIHMNRKSSAFTHTVRYAFGDLSGTCINAETLKTTNKDVGTGFKWKIPESFMNKIPSNTSGSGTIYVDTYNGTTLVGTKTCGFTAKVPVSVKPSCTIQVLDNTNIKDTYGSLIKGLSKLYVKTTFQAAYSSPVKAYNITANGVKYTEAEIVTGALSEAGTTTITATVTDKRERTSDAVSASFSVLDYSPPAITTLAVHRCNMDGTANDRGEYVEILFSGEVTPLDNKNTAIYTVKYKKSSDSIWTSLTTDVNGRKPTDLNNNYAVYNQSYIFEADSNSSYNVVVSVTDNHKTASRPTSASTAFTLINYHPDGNALRLGGVAEKENTFQNDLDLCQIGNSYCYSAVGNDGQSGFVRMAVITINASYADEPIVFEFIQRGKNMPMVVHTCFASTSTAKPSLNTIWYEGYNYNAYITETSDSEWELYVKKAEDWDEITLSRWYTSDRMRKKISIEFPGDHANTVPLGLNGYYHATPAIVRSIIDCVMPVGFVLTLYSHADPNNMYPGTTWVRIQNAFLWGCDASGTIGQTGGAKTHTLTEEEMPSHFHGATYSHQNGSAFEKNRAWYAANGSDMSYGTAWAGGNQPHNNMPPYVQVSIWRRTA